MSTTENTTVSTQDLQKIITLGGLETFYNELKENHFKHINDSITDINNVIEDNEEVTAGAFIKLNNKISTVENTIIETEEAINSALNDLEDEINIINGEGEGSIKKTVNDAIANVIGSAPETFDTLKEIADYIAEDELHAVEVTTTLSNHASAIQSLQDDNVIVKGDAENSAVLKGGNNQVISEGSVALGKNNIVGLKGWYYKRLGIYESGTITIALTKTQQIPVFATSVPVGEKPETDIPFDLEEGDIISVVNDAKYDNLLVITTNRVSTGGYIYAKPVSGNMPFDSIKTDEDLLNGIFDPEDYSIYCLSKPNAGIADMGQGSITGGYDNKATNGKTTAFGFNNHAYGKFSFVEGRDNEAGYAAHAEGRGTKAEGEESHAEGLNTIASGKHSHAEGDITLAPGVNAHAEGYLSRAIGNSSHAEGGCWVKGATGDNRVNGGTAEGAGSHAEGAKTTAIANYSHAEGYRSIAGGPNSHTEGQLTRTGGEDADRPTGNPGTKSGQNAHAEGAVTFAQGAGSHAEGGNTWASGNYSHTEGWQTRTHPTANNSHAEGFYTEVYNRAEHASGQYNKSTKSSNKSEATQFSIGIGTSNTDRKNAVEVKQNGDIYINGLTLPLATLLSSADTDADVESVWNDVIK